MANYYEEITVKTTYALDGGHDFGFLAKGVRFELTSGAGPVTLSFDGTNDHGILGPSGTRAMSVQLAPGRFGSRAYLASAAGGETVGVWAWD